jgi:hypothetical protein
VRAAIRRAAPNAEEPISYRMSDPIKASSPEAVRTLHDLGLRVIMLTGDNEKTARMVGEWLGIDEFQAGVRPEDKHERVKALKAEGRQVAMASTTLRPWPKPMSGSPWGRGPTWRSSRRGTRSSKATCGAS